MHFMSATGYAATKKVGLKENNRIRTKQKYKKTGKIVVKYSIQEIATNHSI